MDPAARGPVAVLEAAEHLRREKNSDVPEALLITSPE